MRQYRLRYLQRFEPQDSPCDEGLEWQERVDFIEARSDETAVRIANGFLNQEPIRRGEEVLKRKPLDLVCVVHLYALTDITKATKKEIA